MTAGPDEIRDPAPDHYCAFKDALAVSGFCRVPVRPVLPSVYGGEKVGHWSGGVMPLRAE
jgi:hypothetical protein